MKNGECRSGFHGYLMRKLRRSDKKFFIFNFQFFIEIMAPSQKKGEWEIEEIVKRHEDVPQSKIFQSGAGTHRTPKVEDLEFFIQKMARSQKKGDWFLN